ncbi:MAG: hypothetical protein AAFQ43_01135 [Bacteroidota bacterium]
MMRRLSFLLAAALVSGCGAFDCGPFDYDVVEGPAIAQTTSPARDTLTVVFAPEPGIDVAEVWVRLGADLPQPSGNTRQAVVRFDVEYGGFGAETVPSFQAEAVGDTLVIPLPYTADAKALAAASCAPAPGRIVQPVCSPPSPFYRLFITSTLVPEGVQHVRYAVREAYDYRTLTPGAEPAASGARGPRRARTARG